MKKKAAVEKEARTKWGRNPVARAAILASRAPAEPEPEAKADEAGTDE